MARTKAHNRTAEQQAAWEAQEAADAREAAQEPNTELEEPGNHLTGRRRKTTLVLVVLVATLAIGSRGTLWRRERLLWEEYCGKMLRSEFTRMYRMDPSTFALQTRPCMEALRPAGLCRLLAGRQQGPPQTDPSRAPAERGGGTGALGRVPWDVRPRAGGNPSARCARCRVARRSCASVPVEGAVLIVCAALQLVRLAAVDGEHDCRLRRDATPRTWPSRDALHEQARSAAPHEQESR